MSDVRRRRASTPAIVQHAARRNLHSEDPEARAFLQHRVASFGLVAGAIASFGVIFRLSLAAALGYFVTDITHPSLIAQALGVVPLWAVWWICRARPLPTGTLYTIEALGLVGAALGYIVMGSYVPRLPIASLITTYALAFGLMARAVYVPSTARHTAWLGVLLGIPLTFLTFFSYQSGADPKAWSDFLPAEPSQLAIAVSETAQTTMWWALTTLLATLTTRVIYGLRQQVGDLSRLGQYALEGKLGEGGMGVVYRASHAMLRRPTAVKVLKPESDNVGAASRFEREVQLTAKLSHANTVTVFDYGRTPEGLFYYAMELLDGATLTQLVEVDGAQPPERVAHILGGAAKSLAEAHNIGLIHRDIKPSNIMLAFLGGERDVTKVLDFGLVKQIHGVEGSSSETDIRALRGTPLYMAPEAILDPTSIDARSDLYALAAVGWYLLTGRHLFTGTSIVEICGHHLHTPPTPPGEVRGTPIDHRLEALLMRCLAKAQSDRPANCEAFLHDLDVANLPPWTQQDAETWWARYGDSIRSVGEGAVSQSATIAVDFRDSLR